MNYVSQGHQVDIAQWIIVQCFNSFRYTVFKVKIIQ